MLNSGIYKITNTVSGKYYIGSSVNIRKRFVSHLCYLRNDNHVNRHLQRAWNKYGEKFFVFKILLYCDRKNLAFFENRAIEEYGVLDEKHGYNCMSPRVGELTGSNKKELSVKLSKASKGKKKSREHRLNISKGRMGILFSRKHRQNLSESHKGKNLSQETRRKLSELRKNKKHPQAKTVAIGRKIYLTIASAAQDIGVSRATIRNRIKARKKDYAWA